MNKYLTLAMLCLFHTAMAQDFSHLDKEAHQGGQGDYPGNTFASMRHALELGVNTLEMDAQISGGGKVVVSHDPFFRSVYTTTPSGDTITPDEARAYLIFKMPYAEIRKYDIGRRFNPEFPQQKKISAFKPLLSDLIDSAEAVAQTAGRALPFYNIETKSLPFTDNITHPVPEVFVDKIMEVVMDKGVAGRVIIQSFDPRTLEVVHRKYPQVKTALLVNKVTDSQIVQFRKQFPSLTDEAIRNFPTHKSGVAGDLKCLSFKPDYYSPQYLLVTEEMVRYCHRNGIKILPWTPNDKAALASLAAMGVDGIISDYPAYFFEGQ